MCSSRDIFKRVCCTCLCEDRKLFQLCREPDGVNLLYMLLMCDADAYREGFFKDTASWMVCWECCALIKKIKRFRLQTCTALTRLKDFANGWNKEVELHSLTHLSTHNNPATIIETNTFIDCNADQNNIKLETEYSPQNTLENNIENEPHFENQPHFDDKPHFEDEPHFEGEADVQNEQIKIKKGVKIKEFYTVAVINSEELKILTDKRKMELKNVIKCDSCVLGFENEEDHNEHNLNLHTKKENYTPCTICLSYIKNDALATHTSKHYRTYVCKLCEHITHTHKLIVGHLKEMHKQCVGKTKRQKKSPKSDEPMKYLCSECDMTFTNKGAKWKHVQKCHRDGHECATCHKVFTFKHNLHRHELIHKGPPPCTECPQCHKQVRVSLMAAHARTHAARARVACVPCGKAFVCRATYESHLKYANAHATQDALRHACSLCDKKFRSRGELRDHVAYRHDARATHKCPVCNKTLATRRCVTRHVRRAHEGVKENARDKMCDYCGKAFRDKQSLSEHVSRHTGARPLTCARCGRAFRQRAALHAHSRRLHPPSDLTTLPDAV